MNDAPSAAVRLLLDAFGRVQVLVPKVVDGLRPDALAERPRPSANSIAWLVWHLTRIQDDHVAELAGRDQVWIARGWYEGFGLPFPARRSGRVRPRAPRPLSAPARMRSSASTTEVH